MEQQHKTEIISLLLDCFPEKLLPLFQTSQNAAQILQKHINMTQSLQIRQQKQLVGLLGFACHGHSFLNLPSTALAVPIDPHQFYIEIICTNADFRHQGIASQLLAQAIQIARNQHYRELALDVACHNDSAIRLYRRTGFQLTSRRRANPPLQHFTFYRMSLPL